MKTFEGKLVSKQIKIGIVAGKIQRIYHSKAVERCDGRSGAA